MSSPNITSSAAELRSAPAGGTTVIGFLIGATAGGDAGAAGGTLFAPGVGTIGGGISGAAAGGAAGGIIGHQAGVAIVNYLKASKSTGESQNSQSQSSESEGKLKYEANPKHGPEQRGNISPEPTNGPGTLQDSIQVKDTSSGRIGVDKANNEIVVFKETSPNTYHGYSAKWSGLTNEQKSVLIKAGKVTTKGKIIP